MNKPRIKLGEDRGDPYFEIRITRGLNGERLPAPRRLRVSLDREGIWVQDVDNLDAEDSGEYPAAVRVGYVTSAPGPYLNVEVFGAALEESVVDVSLPLDEVFTSTYDFPELKYPILEKLEMPWRDE